jgi:hypothetical protein
MKQETISISEASRRKGVARQTVYNNFHLLDISPDRQVIPNAKFDAWIPIMAGAKIRKEFLKTLKKENN